MIPDSLTLEVIQKRVSYDPLTGEASWKDGKNVGRKIRCLSSEGYFRLKLLGKTYYLHLVCWFLHYGVWPTEQIDHINTIKTDNRLCNLRLATPSQNSANKLVARNNSTGYKGVCYNKSVGKFLARVGANPRVHLGHFNTAKEAAIAYNKAAVEMYGEFAKLNEIKETQEK